MLPNPSAKIEKSTAPANQRSGQWRGETSGRTIDMMGVWDSLCCTLRRCTAGFVVKASADAINMMKESAALRHRGIASRLSLSSAKNENHREKVSWDP